MSLEKKFEFLKTVKMPTQRQFNDCVKEYMEYNGAYTEGGKYGYLVLYNNDDQKKDQKSLNTDFYRSEFSKLSQKLQALVKEGKKIKVEGGDFTHIKINDDIRQKTECRLYLRLLPHNTCKVASLLMTECAAAGLPTHFKFMPSSRLDSLVLYSSYDNVQAFVNIIDSINQQHPELFENAEKIHPLWGSVNGYIGFMEEPIISVPLQEGLPVNISKSANTYRAKLLEDISQFFRELPNGLHYTTTKLIKKFSSRLDIDPRYFPLNESSIIELKNANYNIAEIGSLAYQTGTTV